MTARPNAQLLGNAHQAIEHGDLQPMLAMPSTAPASVRQALSPGDDDDS